ncbi:hypothetical protein [Bradyrhizobium genosp. P]|uniref:hypothetical protein n=1 Tax=Bradyrhizobium genosp. P TaxID=83641 RepID=UPI003CF6AB6A
MNFGLRRCRMETQPFFESPGYGRAAELDGGLRRLEAITGNYYGLLRIFDGARRIDRRNGLGWLASLRREVSAQASGRCHLSAGQRGGGTELLQDVQARFTRVGEMAGVAIVQLQ